MENDFNDLKNYVNFIVKYINQQNIVIKFESNLLSNLNKRF